MSITYTSIVNERLVGQSISSEPHTIGVVGVATSSSGFVQLVEVPQSPSPLSTVSIPGYNEIMSGSPTGTQFLVDYTTGFITFNTAQDGNSILVSYIGLGSEFAATNINELQGPVGVALNYNGSLSNNIVKPASISNTATDDFTFPRDVFVTRNLITPDLTSTSSNTASTGNIRLANNTDSVSWRNFANSADLALTVNTSNQLTFNGIPIETNSLTSAHIFVGNGSNVATDVALSGDATLANTGALTLATVNSNVGPFTYASITVNAKGLITAASSGTAPTTYTAGTGLTLTGTQFSLTAPVTIALGGTNNSTAYTAGSVIFSNGTSLTQDNSNFFWDNTNFSLGIRTTSGLSSYALNVNGNTNIGGILFGGVANFSSEVETPKVLGPSNILAFQVSIDSTSAFEFQDHTGVAFIYADSTNKAVSVGTTTPNTSSILDLQSTTQGFLPPRMTSTQRTAISSPAAGLMVFDTTTAQFYGYNGSGWVILG